MLFYICGISLHIWIFGMKKIIWISEHCTNDLVICSTPSSGIVKLALGPEPTPGLCHSNAWALLAYYTADAEYVKGCIYVRTIKSPIWASNSLSCGLRLRCLQCSQRERRVCKIGLTLSSVLQLIVCQSHSISRTVITECARISNCQMEYCSHSHTICKSINIESSEYWAN